MYLFIAETKIAKYNGHILSRYVEDMCVSIISNPTIEELKEFGFKELVVEPEPEYDSEKQFLMPIYKDGDVITQSWQIKNKFPFEEI